MGKNARRKWQKRIAEVMPAKWTPFARAFITPEEMRRAGLVVHPNIWKNSRYTVTLRDAPRGVTHLSIKRNDRMPIHDWRDLQRIKNELCGVEREAVEIYPAESRCVDEANQYHLWVLPAGQGIGIGFADRFVSEQKDDGSRQRPFEPGAVFGPINVATATRMRDVIA